MDTTDWVSEGRFNYKHIVGKLTVPYKFQCSNSYVPNFCCLVRVIIIYVFNIFHYDNSKFGLLEIYGAGNILIAALLFE